MNRPSPPPEAAKLLEAALDVFVYAPIGFLFEARDVVPKLAERGRGQVTLARLFGRYAINVGQAEADRIIKGTRRSDATETETDGEHAGDVDDDAAVGDDVAGDAVVADDVAVDAVAGDEVAAEGSGVTMDAAPLDAAPAGGVKVDDAPVDAPVDADVPPLAPATPATPRGRAAAPASADLPIPGYDTLSASQVVPRLEALLPEELEAVRAYETAHRSRRTILNRISQLQA